MGVVVSCPVHPAENTGNNVLLELDVALGKDQTIKDNRKETIGVLRRLPKLKNVTERDLVDISILLQEAKEKKAKALRGAASNLDNDGRLTQKDIDDQIRNQSVVRVMRSTTPEELMASMIKYFALNGDVKAKEGQTFYAYHKLLTQSKEKGEHKAVYAKVAGNKGVTEEDIDQCLAEIHRIITHHAAIVKINQAISNQKVDPKDLMAALQNPDAELDLPSGGTDAEPSREREYQILLWEAYTEKVDSKTDVRMDKHDIQRVLLSRDILKRIATLESDQKDELLESLRKDELNISEYLVGDMNKSEEWCYPTLILKRDTEKQTPKDPKETTGENRCEFLTRRQIKNIVKEFKAVWDIQRRDQQELEEHWDQVLRDANFPPEVKKTPKGADFVKLEGYRKLFKDEDEYQKEQKERQEKKAPTEATRGFENLLRRQDVQRIMFELYPAIIEINEVIESFIKAKNEPVKDIDRLQKKCLTAISKQSAQLVKGTLVNNKHKGYLTLLSGKRQPKTGKVDETDKCFKERLTWRQMRDILSDLNDFEDFVEKIMSPKSTDDDCCKHYETKLAAKADMIQYYRYRRKEEDKKRVMEYTQEYEGEGHEELWGHTLLHLAVCFQQKKTAKTICKDAPSLIHTDIGTWHVHRDTYNGLTPFLLAVAHGDFDLVKCMESVKPEDTVTIGRRMNGTVFMGHLPFHTAVLCYLNDPNKDDTHREPENRFVKIIKLLVEGNGVLEGQNYRRDTVLHSIMRFVRCFPACEARAVDMMSWLESLMEKKVKKEDVIDYKRKLFFTKNENHMTALQLATECGHMSLFACFLKIKGVYLIAYPHDDLYEIRRFDVTEIDKVALLEAQQCPTQSAKKETDKEGHPTEAADAGSKAQIPQGSSNASKKDGEIKEGKDQPKTLNSSVDNISNQSVAELLCCQDLQVATKLVSADVFEEMVRRKLKTYLNPFRILCFGHVSLIILLCVYVVARAAASEGISWPPRGFLEFCNVVTFLSSFLYFVQEFPLRFCFGKQPFTWTAFHHNVVYRVLFVLFAGFLFVDSILYRIPDSVFVDYKTLSLILAILAGTWSILFFLRMSKYFSLYIVLLNEALIRAVVPFACLILMQVLVFSACMHATFLHPEQGRDVLSDFSHYGKSLLTMGKLMIGLTEIGELLDSREDFIIVFLFALFLLITFLLMINALIGVMTNRFHDTQTNREMVCRLQELSIIIFIEGWFSERTKKLGFPRLGVDPEESNGDNADEAIRTNTDEYSTKRFVMSYRKVRSSTADNPANAEHILRKQVKRSEELNNKIDRLLDLQETKSYDGTRALNIYHYSY